MLDLYHKRLKIWKLAMSVLKQIYHVTRLFPDSERFGLTSQIQRAAVSVCSNIAEGSARISNKEKHRYFEIARSSLVEIDAQIEICLNLDYVRMLSIKQLSADINLLFAMLTCYMNNLKKRK